MPVLLLNLRDVPADEAEEVRALLDAEGIEWYETKPSLWGVSAGGLWLSDPDQQEQARALLQACVLVALPPLLSMGLAWAASQSADLRARFAPPAEQLALAL